ncbi:MAG: hypothetical protein ABIB71_04710 [Candidatus Woesearchaeota archaeon]
MSQCPYCKEFKKGFFEFQDQTYRRHILCEKGNFVVFPSLGQIVEGYLLIASKKHYNGMGEVPKSLYPELESVCKKVREVLSNTYGSPLFFEHGSTLEKKGGCCITHAHIHAVPVQIDILEDLTENFDYRKMDSFEELQKEFKKGNPYLFYESNSKERYLFEVNETIPSQYIRQIIAEKINKPERWDWRTYPGIDELVKTIEKLKGKFE